LTGYWPDDPRTQGWLWPSQEIWTQRLATMPGVSWVRGFDDRQKQAVGVVSDELFLLLEGEQLLLVESNSGVVMARTAEEKSLLATLLHEETGDLYLLAEEGELTAVAAADLAAGRLSAAWRQPVVLSGSFNEQLFPKPGGGVLLLDRGRLTAFAADGAEIWHVNLSIRPDYFLLVDKTVFLAADERSGSELWQVTAENTPQPVAEIGGKLAADGEWLWIYGREAVYRMSLAELQSPLQVVYRLPPGSVSRGDLLTMADGGVMVAHSDAVDRRLLRFSADGMLVWERSYAGQLNGDVRLQRLGADIYVTAQSELGNDGDMTLYALSAANNRLTMLFRSGTRTPLPGGSWTAVLPDHLLINTGGGPLALLDPQAALMASGVR